MKAPGHLSVRSNRNMPRQEGHRQENSVVVASDVSSNDPFGSRPEPGAYLIAFILLLPPGEVPEGRARGVQDTAARVQSESEG